MIVPSIGTSIVAFKLICARLQLHASGASKPRLASSVEHGEGVTVSTQVERDCSKMLVQGRLTCSTLESSTDHSETGGDSKRLHTSDDA